MMDSNMDSPPPENSDSKAAFRKPLNDKANRKYRRHSPADGSLSSDGSPKRGCSSNPVIAREDSSYRKVDDRREFDRDSGRSQDARRGDSYRNSDCHSRRSSHNYDKHDDYTHDKPANYNERNKSFYKSAGGSRGGARFDNYKGESNPSNDYVRDADKYPRDKYDGAGHRSMGKWVKDQKYEDRDLPSDRRTISKYDDNKYGERDTHMRTESRRKHTETNSGKDVVAHLPEESHKRDFKEPDDSKQTRQEKRKHNDWETNRHKERFCRPAGEEYEDKTEIGSKIQQSPPKKLALSGFDRGPTYEKDAVQRGSTSSKHAMEDVAKLTLEQAQVNNSELAPDHNAAKVAAIKAAELVNRNLVGGGVSIGVGVLSTDQKKKLLWGSKKNTAVEESGHRWDATLFPDRERQEKFNKLMGVKGDVKISENKQDTQGGNSLVHAEKQKELQLDLEKQYTAGLRRRDGRTVGLGL